MKIAIRPGKARGEVRAPSSKSSAHRLLIASGLAEGESRIRGIDLSDDVLATMGALGAFGAEIRKEGDAYAIRGVDPRNAKPRTIDCRESATTLRIFLPLALLAGGTTLFTGSERLFARPLSVYETIAKEKGFRLRRVPGGLEADGSLPAGEYRFPGDISSQFTTGLLFALPHLAGESRIGLLEPVKSRPYIDLTLAELLRHGVRVERTAENRFRIPGRQRFSPLDAGAEGDWTNAAVLEGLNLLGGDVRVTGLSGSSLQGDRVFREHFDRLLRGEPEIDLSDCPDLGPVLMALAAVHGGAVFRGTERLRFKESDRVEAMRSELARFGIKTETGEDRVRIPAAKLRKPDSPLSGHGDHRVVMALSLLLTLTGGEIDGAEAVTKSFPDFFERLSSLGIGIERG
ncbi:MAG: 3-phosphoshikimate 1-carboxyvinyltransferase [Clostridia bacterium]|nr:3-phosphoshikimate 1-carboxyvinyltransferase [Clostridia bacterium]